MTYKLYKGDNLEILQTFAEQSINLIYLDPPFFTQKIHKLRKRNQKKEFSYADLWQSHETYAEFLFLRIQALYRVLAPTGSLFFHCDRNASHIVRAILDAIFGSDMFQSEIIWSYKRWSRSQKRLLPAHQTIYFYTKSTTYTFNMLYQDYSPATNVDQILQKRERDNAGKSVYAKDNHGNIIPHAAKKGVPLSDVWDIPYLNPKAHERTGYPTQKPILLLERIIQLASNKGDTVLDPFCGSGTALVAAILLNRKAIGIDSSDDAIALSRQRLINPVKTESRLRKLALRHEH